MVVLDSTFLVDLSRGNPKASRLRQELEDTGIPLRVPAAAWIEYLSVFDAKKRVTQQANLERATLFEPFDREAAQNAAQLQYELFRMGTPLGWHDLQIAATAVHYGEAVVTNDEKFREVPRLEVIPH